MRNRVLFILKRRENSYGDPGHGGQSKGFSSGLSNSVSFVVGMLKTLGIEAKAVEVEDNNCIDREVTSYRPTHVIIEAYWVVPEKFDLLKPLHPTVQWIVRNHSEVPFLANEGIAFGWTAAYLKRGVEVMCNAPRALDDMRVVARALGMTDRLVTYGPNYYPIEEAGKVAPKDLTPGVVNIGCFGAIRPLKNTIAQAIAALAYATAENCKLRFHINGGRIEGNGDPILKNLRQLFAASTRHELVEWPWYAHEDFVAHLEKNIDVCLQVSLSETFNIVSADATAANVPVVVSSEVPWIGCYAHASPLDSRSIEEAIWVALRRETLHSRLRFQRRDLADYSTQTREIWAARFGAPVLSHKGAR